MGAVGALLGAILEVVSVVLRACEVMRSCWTKLARDVEKVVFASVVATLFDEFLAQLEGLRGHVGRRWFEMSKKLLSRRFLATLFDEFLARRGFVCRPKLMVLEAMLGLLGTC